MKSKDLNRPPVWPEDAAQLSVTTVQLLSKDILLNQDHQVINLK